jgi:FAD/FMN-containing dehydrogenase
VKGAANIDDSGVLVALSGFQNITVHADQNTVDAGPGLGWYDVNVALEPYGKVAIGGRLKTIGVAGLTLGGGIHYFNNKYGFSMDNVVAYEIVTGEGRILTTTATEYSDLFWALKGGSNNFGIVTKFTLKTYDIPLVSTQLQTFTEDQEPAFLKATSDLANFEEENIIGAGGIIVTIYVGALGVIIPQFSGVQEGSTLEPSHFQNFSAIPSLSKTNQVETLAQYTSTLDTPYQLAR